MPFLWQLDAAAWAREEEAVKNSSSLLLLSFFSPQEAAEEREEVFLSFAFFLSFPLLHSFNQASRNSLVGAKKGGKWMMQSRRQNHPSLKLPKSKKTSIALAKFFFTL